MNAYLPALCRAAGLPEPHLEYRFAPPRRWRFDFAWPDWRLAIEVDGGAWVQGRHTRGGGFRKDMEKNNAAMLLHWRVLHYMPDQLQKNAIADLMQILPTVDTRCVAPGTVVSCPHEVVRIGRGPP